MNKIKKCISFIQRNIALILSVIALILSIVICCIKVKDLKTKNYDTDNFDYKKIEIVSWKNGEAIFGAEGCLKVDNFKEGEITIVIKISKKEYKKFSFYLSEDYMYYIEEVENKTDNPYAWNITFRNE